MLLTSEGSVAPCTWRPGFDCSCKNWDREDVSLRNPHTQASHWRWCPEKHQVLCYLRRISLSDPAVCQIVFWWIISFYFMSFRRGRLPRVLVLAPTRELARQVEKEIKESAPYLNTVCVYGGVSYITQQNALSRGVDVVVGTPGRIIDLINGNSLRLGEVEYLVLDEADQMLAVGFEEDVEVILEKLPAERQSMLFSATMPGWVKKLARKYLNDPLTIDLVSYFFIAFLPSFKLVELSLMKSRNLSG